MLKDIFFPPLLFEINGEADSLNTLEDQKFKESSKLLGIYLVCKASDDNCLVSSLYKKLFFNIMVILFFPL